MVSYQIITVQRVKTTMVFFKDCLIEWALQTLDDIDAGAPLFEYVRVLGRQKTVGTTADNDDYIVAFEHNGQQYQLDALRKGNLARFVNHSCQPNCCAVLITTAVPIASTATVGDQQHQHGQQQVPSVLVFALRHIFAGEEITLDYGEPWWLSKACPCLCGNEKCKYDRDWWANLVQNGTNLAQGYGKQMACKSTKDGTNLAWAYGKQMACKTAAPLPLQLQQHTARKSVVTLPMALSRIEVGPSFGNLPCIDMKLTGDQLAQLLNME